MKPLRFAPLFFLVGLIGCGDGSSNAGQGGAGGQSSAQSSSGMASPCVPGVQASCACIGGGLGVQVCKADGSGFDVCQGCDPAGSGGAGGVGSSSSSSSSSSSTTGSSSGTPIPCPAGPNPNELDLHQVTVYSNPPNLADWPVTTSLTQVNFDNDGVFVNFSKKDGPDRWPDIIPPGWMGPLQYTLGDDRPAASDLEPIPASCAAWQPFPLHLPAQSTKS